ncbi:MAG TPA: MFS transporter, partial [Clostridiales bacterium]|nr:MFS transporter [Clostridiales bacterium]
MAQPARTSVVHQDRRYVGSKETLGYILFDVAGGFNISDYGERYIYDVLKIDLSLLAIVNGINSVWDIVNDTFIGTIVDKTRTRWGKFKPYLMITAVPGTLLGCLGWLMPYMFNQDPMNMAKFGMYLALAMIGEGLGTFRGISVGGYLAAILLAAAYAAIG